MVKAQGNNKNTSVKATSVYASPNVNAKPVVNNLSVNGVNDLSKYYSELSKDYAEQAQQSAEEAKESANRAEESAEIASNIADSILNNEQIQEVFNNIDIIVASPENAQIAKDSATLAQSYATDAKGYAENAKEYRDDIENILDTKQDKLTAGDGISIENNVISNTRTNAEWGNITGDLNNQTDLQNELDSKQDKLTAGSNIIIEDNKISSTAQESFFRGRWETWENVPNDANSYPEDFNGNRTPTTNDYMVVVDASQYTPGMTESIIISKEPSSHILVINGVNVGKPNQTVTYTFDTVTYTVESTNGGGSIKVFANKNVQYNGQLKIVGTPVILTAYASTIKSSKIYYSKLDNLSGTWRFGYKGVWADDNESGWKPEYQIEEVMPIATETQAGIAKLYTATGSNTDGAMTQKAITENTTQVIIRRWE